ncbi:DUF5681 domain-containing protein [Sphingosinicella sp. BN140058]|uniref:DUF5681 domain-containing protein n=1 Tax=Sphingosinicella sp. BN140058 TaxID=1892855 RepID=UPI0010109280|nr:DUF5681 domain-containing protein [Sphingosinicella sp. BN140058]QAY75226.1 hypothetical protein ETR14_00775 [Sphingosinicella sp. BN140058]
MCDLSNTPTRAATGRFLPGTSGNPAGRPLGARNKASTLREMLDAAESEAVVRAVVDRALAGDWPALRACFTRLVPPARAEPVEIDLPPIATMADVADAGAALIAAVAAGDITPGDAQKVMSILTRQLKLLAAAPTRGAQDEIDVDAGARPVEKRACISPVFTAAPEHSEARHEPSSAAKHPPARPEERAPPHSAPVDTITGANTCISPVLTAATQSFATHTSFTAKLPPIMTPPVAEATIRSLASAASGALANDHGRTPRLCDPSCPCGEAQDRLRGEMQPRSSGNQRGTEAHAFASLFPGARDAQACISPVFAVAKAAHAAAALK